MKKSVMMTVCLLGAAGLCWLAQAGNLEPSDPPAPTMKSLVKIPPTWSERLDSTNGSTLPLWEGCGSSRFECVMAVGSPYPVAEAVLDHETGLVWERSPDGNGLWTQAVSVCRNRIIGGRVAWRLPASAELASLVDPDQSEPPLPPGHPFLNVTEAGYWSSTTEPSDPNEALYLWMGFGSLIADSKLEYRGIWCVRGGTPNTFTSRPN
jgi:hypothetical protein